MSNCTFPQRPGAARRMVPAMTRLGSLVVTVLMAAGLNAAAAASPAHAQTPGCVSAKEVRQVEDHAFTKVRVHRIFETRGKITRADRWMQDRTYRGCPPRSRVWVFYTWEGDAFRVRGVWTKGRL